MTLLWGGVVGSRERWCRAEVKALVVRDNLLNQTGTTSYVVRELGDLMVNGVQDVQMEQMRTAVHASDNLLLNLINKIDKVYTVLEGLERRIGELELPAEKPLTRRGELP